MDQADVLIVGGGLVGCATAFHLARAGLSVVVAEAGDVNAVASGQNAGSLHFQMERRFLEQGEAVMAQAARVISLNRQAIEEWRGLEEMLGTAVGVSMNGGLMVAETPDQVALLERKARLEEAAGMSSRLIDKAEVRVRAPYLGPRVVAALWAPDEGHADPKKVTPAFAAGVRSAGARIHSHMPLRDLEKRDGGFVASLASADGQLRIFRIDKGGLPRGLYCNMGTCCECMVQVGEGDRAMALRACLLPAVDGQRISTVSETP